MRRAAWAAALLAAAAAGATVVTGRAPATGDAEADRAAALADARRRAVETAVGVIVDSSVRLENQLIIEDELLTKSKGLVKNEVVTAEREADGFYEVTLSCDVEDLGLAAELDRLKNSFVVDVGATLADGGRSGAAASIIRQRLVAAGFRCLDENFVRPEAGGNLANAAEMPAEELRLAGRRYLARVIVCGDVELADAGVVAGELPYVKENPLAGLRVAYAAGVVRAVDTTSGRVLAERRSRPREFAGFGDDAAAAAEDALYRLAAEFGAYLEGALADFK